MVTAPNRDGLRETYDNAADLSPPASEMPTGARWTVLGYLFSLTVILYLDRICISLAAPHIEQELGITHQRMGIIFAAFNVAYALFEVSAGRWGDKYGSRGVLARIVLWWSVFTILTGCVWRFSYTTGIVLPRISWSSENESSSLQALVWSWSPLVLDGFLVMLVIRFLFGAGEAGALPNAARISANWFSPAERPVVQGWIVTGMSLGGTCAPILAGFLIEQLNWRWAFAIFGALGFVWTALFYRWFRDKPHEHPDVNRAELNFIQANQPPPSADHAAAHPPIPWRLVLRSLNVWVLAWIMVACSFSAYLFMTWYPTYLIKGLNVEPATAKYLASLVLGGSAIGCFMGGYLSRWAGNLPMGRKWGRRWLGFGSLLISSLLLCVCGELKSPVLASCAAALVGVAAFSQQPNWWAAVTETSGPHLGAMFGLLNSMGVPGSMGSTLFMGWFADYRKDQGYLGAAQWNPAFYIYAAVVASGAVMWLLVNVEQSMVEPASPADSGHKTA